MKVEVGSLLQFIDFYDRSRKIMNTIYGIVIDQWGVEGDKSIRVQWLDGKSSLEHVRKTGIENKDIKVISF